jgi:hypothetical protein
VTYLRSTGKGGDGDERTLCLVSGARVRVTRSGVCMHTGIEGACMGVESMHHVFGARVVWLDVRLNLHLPYAIFIREGVKSDSMESWWGWASKVWTWTQPTQRGALHGPVYSWASWHRPAIT